MKTDKQKLANMLFMRKYRVKNRRKWLLSKAKCPVCEMRLDPIYEQYHMKCPYWLEIFKEPPLPKRIQMEGMWMDIE